ncbi:MAG: hypothetical protein ICV68_11410 [Pyrinomonadaceae bacterium]|nr:hypothetical protein [Pyrinomonadaceae bacterium]
MRLLVLSLTLAALSALSACASGNEQKASNPSASNTTTSTTTTTTTAPPTNTTATRPSDAYQTSPIAPAHRSGSADSSPSAQSPSANEQTGIDTSAQDAKIAQAEAKAKATNATQADKLAAAAAYMERGDIFMQAGRPTLYKYALRDYRRTLRYQPDNRQAQDSINTIVAIYKQLGRPVPDLGNEP